MDPAIGLIHSLVKLEAQDDRLHGTLVACHPWQRGVAEMIYTTIFWSEGSVEAQELTETLIESCWPTSQAERS
jgi:hypothetical protein